MIILCYVLATLWALGLLGCVIWGCLNDFMFDSWIGRTIWLLICLPLWVTFGLGPFALIEHEAGPVEATLLKSEWQCSASHQETATSMIMVGKVMVPTTITSNVCDQYNKK